MGQEIRCRVDFGKQTSEGKALLETNEVIFRGGFRLKIPHASIAGMSVRDGKLTVAFPEGEAIFHLGEPAAEKWAERIRNPPSRLDKLGVKPGTRVRFVGPHDEDFLQELRDRGAETVARDPDIVFLRAGARAQLAKIGAIAAPALWIVYPKGLKSITENDVIAAGRAAGLKDTKVASFSATHTALRFSRPRT
jgi:hypothetical protein